MSAVTDTRIQARALLYITFQLLLSYTAKASDERAAVGVTRAGLTKSGLKIGHQRFNKIPITSGARMKSGEEANWPLKPVDVRAFDHVAITAWVTITPATDLVVVGCSGRFSPSRRRI